MRHVPDVVGLAASQFLPLSMTLCGRSDFGAERDGCTIVIRTMTRPVTAESPGYDRCGASPKSVCGGGRPYETRAGRTPTSSASADPS